MVTHPLLIAIVYFIADLLFNLDRFDEAEKIVWDLLDRNPDCKLYYEMFYKITEARSKCEMKLTDKRKMLENCTEKFFFARLPRLLFLETLDGNSFASFHYFDR